MSLSEEILAEYVSLGFEQYFQIIWWKVLLIRFHLKQL